MSHVNLRLIFTATQKNIFGKIVTLPLWNPESRPVSPMGFEATGRCPKTCIFHTKHVHKKIQNRAEGIVIMYYTLKQLYFTGLLFLRVIHYSMILAFLITWHLLFNQIHFLPICSFLPIRFTVTLLLLTPSTIRFIFTPQQLFHQLSQYVWIFEHPWIQQQIITLLTRWCHRQKMGQTKGWKFAWRIISNDLFDAIFSLWRSFWELCLKYM